MKKYSHLALSLMAASLLTAGASEAALIDRGGGLIYDDVLNVTWLQDAQYALTTGASEYGNLTWHEANSWVSTLEFNDSARGVTWDDWRLPSTINASSSLGYDTTGQSSELAYMYYINLGYDPNYSHDRYDPAPESTNYNPFINISYRAYWSGTAADRPGQAWLLHFHFGSQETNGMLDGSRVWAVRDGDVGVASVPEPGTLGLLGFGLAAVGYFGRRRRVAALV
jgi:hypothetical protein